MLSDTALAAACAAVVGAIRDDRTISRDQLTVLLAAQDSDVDRKRLVLGKACCLISEEQATAVFSKNPQLGDL